MSTTNSNSNEWALILGGSSGFGLATAHKLSRHGFNICVVHRDRRGAMKRIEPEFEAIRERGVSLLTFNADALSAEKREEILDGLEQSLGPAGKVRVLLHSIAFGNLKLIAPEAASNNDARERLAAAMDVDAPQLAETVDGLFEQQVYGLQGISTAPEYSAHAFIEEEDLHFYTLIDASSSMAFGEPSKLHYAKQLAAALGFIGLCRADRVKIEVLGAGEAKPSQIGRAHV